MRASLLRSFNNAQNDMLDALQAATPLKPNARVEHSMGHTGIVVRVEGVRALVRFVNTLSWVYTSDLEVQG
jgi:hypothetical protein